MSRHCRDNMYPDLRYNENTSFCKPEYVGDMKGPPVKGCQMKWSEREV